LIRALSAAIAPFTERIGARRIAWRRAASPGLDIGGAFRIGGFVIAEFLKPKNAGEQSGILLIRHACGVQLSARRFSSALCGAMFAPTDIFCSHVRRRQSNSAYDDQQQHDIETHIDHPSMNLKAPTAPPVGYSIDCKEPILNVGVYFTVGDLFSKIAPAAAQFLNRYQPGP
jgi:hypothetical protein